MTQNEEYNRLVKKANIALVLSVINFVPTVVCILGAVYMYVKGHLEHSYPFAIAGFLLCNIGMFLTFIGHSYVQKAYALQ